MAIPATANRAAFALTANRRALPQAAHRPGPPPISRRLSRRRIFGAIAGATHLELPWRAVPARDGQKGAGIREMDPPGAILHGSEVDHPVRTGLNEEGRAICRSRGSRPWCVAKPRMPTADRRQIIRPEWDEVWRAGPERRCPRPRVERRCTTAFLQRSIACFRSIHQPRAFVGARFFTQSLKSKPARPADVGRPLADVGQPPSIT